MTDINLPPTASEKLKEIVAKLKKDRPALASVVEAMAMSNTARDQPESIAKEVAVLLAAREHNSDLKKALDYYESTEKVNRQKDRILGDLGISE